MSIEFKLLPGGVNSGLPSLEELNVWEQGLKLTDRHKDWGHQRGTHGLPGGRVPSPCWFREPGTHHVSVTGGCQHAIIRGWAWKQERVLKSTTAGLVCQTGSRLSHRAGPLGMCAQTLSTLNPRAGLLGVCAQTGSRLSPRAGLLGVCTQMGSRLIVINTVVRVNIWKLM